MSCMMLGGVPLVYGTDSVRRGSPQFAGMAPDLLLQSRITVDKRLRISQSELASEGPRRLTAIMTDSVPAFVNRTFSTLANGRLIIRPSQVDFAWTEKTGSLFELSFHCFHHRRKQWPCMSTDWFIDEINALYTICVDYSAALRVGRIYGSTAVGVLRGAYFHRVNFASTIIESRRFGSHVPGR
jgi:hypothetical protein